MAGSAIGELLVRLGLDATDFTSGMTKAEQQAKESGGRIKETLLGTFAGNLLSSATDEIVKNLASLPGRVKEIITKAIDEADHLNDLSKKTGIAVETLGGLGFAAKQAGGDLESISDAEVKLERTIASAGAGGKQQVELFKALGISVRDASGHLRNAGDVTKDLADKFAGYADGPNKAALAVALFGKAGASIIPLLNDGGAALQSNIDYYQRYGGVTSEVAGQADQFNDTLEKIRLLSGAFARTLAADLLPVLQVLADKFLSVKENGNGMKDVAADLTTIFVKTASAASYLVEWINSLTTRLGALAAIGAALAEGNLTGALQIRKDLGDDLDRTAKKFDAFRDSINGANAAAAGAKAITNAGDFRRADIRSSQTSTGRLRTASDKPEAPGLPKVGGAGKSDDPAKALLDNQLKALEAGIARERDLIRARDAFLDLANQQNLLSTAQYYGAKRAYQEDAVTAEIAAYDKEIAALREYQSLTGRTQKDIAAAEGKIEEATRRKEKVQADATQAAAVLSIQEQIAVKKLRDEFDGLTASVLDYQEHLAAAAAIKFDVSNDAIRSKAQAEGNEQALQNIETLRAATIAQAKYQEVATQSGRSYADLSRQEAALNAAVASGSSTSLSALQAIGEARRAAIPLLEQQVAAEEAIAAASGSGALVEQAKAARAALEQLKTTVDPLGDKFREIGQSATENFLDKVLSGTVKLKDAFKSLVKDIAGELLKISNKEVAQTLFKKDGVLGGAFSSLGNLFGQQSQKAAGADATKAVTSGASAAASSAAATADSGDAFKSLATSVGGTDSALGSLSLTTPILDSAFTALTSSAAALAVALDAAASSAASNSAKGVGDSLLDSGLLESAKGNVFDRGNVLPFARGGVVAGPTLFPMANGGTGLMGEAGPEAIVPLQRGANGALGIASTGGGDTYVTNINNSIQDVRARQSQAQLVSVYSRAIDKRKRSRSA